MNESKKNLAEVSVIIPCFRCAATIARAVTSVARQTLLPAELILVDDGNDDGTSEALHEIADKYSLWVKVIALAFNQGPASARNIGWEAASQPYVGFLDADDAWHPDKLNIQYQWMRRNPEVAASGHQVVLLREEIQPSFHPEKIAFTRIRPNKLLYKNAFSTPSVILKRDLSFRFMEGQRWAEDYDLWLRVVFSGLSVFRIEAPLAFIYKAPYGEGGLSKSLWKMECAELENYRRLFMNGQINWAQRTSASAFSLMKFGFRFARAAATPDHRGGDAIVER
jgi:glycosyltransferase involved in cell wall biosynthesis